MPEQVTFLTPNGLEKVQRNLDWLRNVRRPQVIKQLQEALEQASAQATALENPDYEAAKNEQAFIEGRLNELESKLASADIVDPDPSPTDRAVFGRRVVLENIDTGEIVEYQLVGPDESNIQKGRISVSSPLGKAILGNQKGAEITLQVPGGKRCYELVDIV